ncbi:nuclear transport factor 2 family protein [Rhodococcus chondri]|uniref:Nuclear transport factor 2 family protein n=1 Tax=Rhodococcus chondri TaxID=3065941 RepID=A0ABU7JXS5_9NOCA|nr:nuclear transport factor 2 family protein [Rhodococcus sp. CC-R104]MEE2034815.1 nuclear transport factor 2 family protein [Rhodococcus sp. CC-R104]
MDLEAVREIKRLKYRYARALDTRSWAELADTLVPEATAVYGEYLSFESRDAFINFLESTLGAHMLTEHHCSHPQIEISEDGATATGIWLLADTVIVPEDKMFLRGSAYYHDRYVLCPDGQWRISQTGYERNWETAISLEDLPSFRLTTNQWSKMRQPPRAS